MVEIFSLANVFLQNGSGFVFRTLLSDLLLVGIIAFLITAVVVPVIAPMVKPVIALRDVAKEIGGPKPHWFFGNMAEYGFNHKGLMNMAALSKQFPAMCVIYRSVVGLVIAYHPDVAKKVLGPSHPKSVFTERFLKVAFREGLVASSGELWKRHRKLLTPMFHHGILKGYCKVFNKNSEIFLNECETFAQTGKPCEVTEAISSTSYANMMECIMSQTDDSSSGMKFLHSTVKSFSAILMSRLGNPFLWPDSLFFLSEGGRLLKEAHGGFEKVVSKIINERRRLLAIMQGQNNPSDENIFTDAATGKSHTFRKHKGRAMDFLDILIQTKDEDGKGLSDEEIYDEVATFFIAGQETITTALSWIVYHIAVHEDCQERCRSEIQSVLGEKEECDQSDLPKLIYLTQCIKESMRLCPPIHSVARSLVEDMKFSHRFNNYKEITIQKGTVVSVNVFALHRNPHVWDNPEVYDPERFSPENIVKIPPFAYLPFVAGPRNCIGQNFAMNQMKIFMAHALRSYKFRCPPNTPEPKMNVGISVTPQNGIMVIVKPVEG